MQEVVVNPGDNYTYLTRIGSWHGITHIGFLVRFLGGLPDNQLKDGSLNWISTCAPHADHSSFPMNA